MIKKYLTNIIENKYWEEIKNISDQILKDMDYNFDELMYQKILNNYSKIINNLSDDEIIKKFKFKFDAMKREGRIK
jgi:hypothetical protein